MRRIPPSSAVKLMGAAELIAERGLDNTKIEDFAAATGIPKATLYYYFESKEEILSYIFGVVLDAIGEAVERGIASAGPAAKRLTRVVDHHLGVFSEYTAASQALHFDLGRATRRPELAERINSSYLDPVSELIKEGVADGSFRRIESPRIAAVALLGATSTAAIHVLAIDPGDSLKAVSKTIVPLVLRGVEAAR